MINVKDTILSNLLENVYSHISGGTSKEDILKAMLAAREHKLNKKSGVLYYPACGSDILPLFLFSSIKTFIYINNKRIDRLLIALTRLFNTPLDDKKPIENREYIIDCLRITPPMFEITEDCVKSNYGEKEYTATFILEGKPKIMKIYKRMAKKDSDNPEEVKKGIDIYYSDFPETETEFLNLGIAPYLKKDAHLFTPFKPTKITGVKYQRIINLPPGKNSYSIKQK